MFLPEICIKRPVLATVLSLSLLAVGLVGYSRLPVRELPAVDFPVISVSTVLPGASAQVVETEITEVLEEELNGIEGVQFIRSVSTEQVSSITLQFELRRDIDSAAQDVRDKVARVRRRLPEDAQQPRVSKVDLDAQAIMWLALHSSTRNPFERMHMVDKVIKPLAQGVPGVGSVLVGGSNRKAIRIELNRSRLAAHGITVGDVERALMTRNVELPSGRVEGQWREFVVRTHGEVSSPEEFEELVITTRNGHPVRVGDVGEARYGFNNERTRARFNGTPTSGLGIVKQSGSNTLTVTGGVKDLHRRLDGQLPEGYQLDIAYDQSGFIEESVREVKQSLVVAGVLVLLVIFVFLQSMRTTLIPSITMPVAIMFAFGVLYFLDFSINNLTLLALTLVIGVVVDDAIIVVENIYRHMENGATRTQAAITASGEITFAVISTTLTLLAVFVPIAFMSGVVGRFFYEFGIAVAVAVSASSFVALTLTPMLCSRFLSVGSTTRREGVLGSMARRFDSDVEALSRGYRRALEWSLNHGRWLAALLLLAIVVSGLLFKSVGKEFLPQDDRGYFIAVISTPEGSTLDYQDRYQRQVEKLLDTTTEVATYFSILAITRGGPGKVNSGIMFVGLQPHDQRERSMAEVLGELRGRAASIAGADAYFLTSNALQRSRRSKPLQFVIQHNDFDELARQALLLKTALEGEPGFIDVDTDLEMNKPQLNVEIDREKAAALGISPLEIADSLRILLGGADVSRFRQGNERYDVILQLEAAHRLSPGDLSSIYVRTRSGELVTLENVVTVTEDVGPSEVIHYNRKRAVVVEANLEDLELGQAIERTSQLAADLLPQGFTTDLAGESREYARGSRGLSLTFLFAVMAIYLVLAAQFESFVQPITIMLALPLAVLGALAGLLVTGMTLNMYSFIGIIMLMGLVTKNSILLVDYINILRARGVEIREAILEAGSVRLRPILMTAFSTIFGILPIALGSGPGAESRRPLGVAVVTGMILSTVLTLMVVPVFYRATDRIVERFRSRKQKPQPEG
jgi:multidrug efflux pump